MTAKTPRQWAGLAILLMLGAFVGATAIWLHWRLRQEASGDIARGQALENAALRQIVAASPIAMVGLGPHGKVRLWTVGAERFFGYTAAEAIGRDAAFLMPDGDSEAHTKAMISAFKTANQSGRLQNNTVTCLALRRDGKQFRVQITLVVAGEMALAVFRALPQGL